LDKPTPEQMKDFEEHIGWRYLKEWIDERMQGIKGTLLNARTIDEVKDLQMEYETYKSILIKVKRP
jgi:hypothetical protein